MLVLILVVDVANIKSIGFKNIYYSDDFGGCIKKR